MASTAERNARLDALSTAVNSWADNKKKRLEKEAKLLKKILKGRTGSDRLSNASNEAASTLLVDELSQFLTGD
jgi:hypothetical protein